MIRMNTETAKFYTIQARKNLVEIAIRKACDKGEFEASVPFALLGDEEKEMSALGFNTTKIVNGTDPSSVSTKIDW